MTEVLKDTDRSKNPIGLFDSGLGGLTVIRELKKNLPLERYIYLGDCARTPYGSKGKDTIIRYALECAGFLESKQVKAIIIACNTVSSYAYEILKERCACPVVSVIYPVVEDALRKTVSGRIGVVGTKATISSQSYERLIRSLNPAVKVFSKACPLFVPLVEEGLWSGEATDYFVNLYLREMKEAGIDVLILGCTHYLLLEDALVGYLGSGIELIDSGAVAAAEVKKELLALGLMNNEPGEKAGDRYYLTDTPQDFKRLAALFLGSDSLYVEKIDPF